MNLKDFERLVTITESYDAPTDRCRIKASVVFQNEAWVSEGALLQDERLLPAARKRAVEDLYNHIYASGK